MIPRPIHRLFLRQPRLYAALLELMHRGSLEKRLFLRLVRPGWTICDIGANRGHFTELFSELAGPHGAVHAFEPSPETFVTLQRMVAALPSAANVTLHGVALSDQSGEAELHQPDHDDGQASLRTHRVGSWGAPTEVRSFSCQLVPLDEIARSWSRLDFIKCDVEGAELPALRGARETLARFSPIIFAEVYEEWTAAFGYHPRDLVAFLSEQGYSVFYLLETKVQRYQPGAPIVGPANLLAAKAGSALDGLKL